MKIVFDTYAWIEYFEGSKKGELVSKFLEEKDILTPSIVLLELSYKADLKKWNIKEIFNFIKVKSNIVGINEQFIINFGEIYNDAKKKNKNFGIADAIILMTSKLNEAKILTGDHHFSIYDNAIILE